MGIFDVEVPAALAASSPWGEVAVDGKNLQAGRVVPCEKVGLERAQSKRLVSAQALACAFASGK